MKRIIAVHHSDGRTEYACKKCGHTSFHIHTTGSGDALFDHFTCQKCGFTETETEAWQRHKAQVFKNIKADKSEAMFQ